MYYDNDKVFEKVSIEDFLKRIKAITAATQDGKIYTDENTSEYEKTDKAYNPVAEDVINAPKHYMLMPEKGIEVRDLMQTLASELEQTAYSAMFISDYIQMQQYLLRFYKKNGQQDLEKARWYLDKLISANT